MESNNFDQGRKTPQPLLNADPQNAWYLDLATDIDLGQKKTSDAINRLKNARELRTNPVLELNLANALLQGGQPGEAATILNRYTLPIKRMATAVARWPRVKARWAIAIREAGGAG